MRLFLKLLFLSVMLILVPACHLPVSTDPGPNGLERYRLAVESWPGAHIDELAAAWPRPWFKGQTTLDDGSLVYSFIRQEQYFRQAEQYYDHAHNEWVEKTPAGTELSVCETRFVTDPQGVITAVDRGNHQCGQISPPPARPKK